MIKLSVEVNEDFLYMQVYESIKNDIRDGSIKANKKILSKRKLSQNLGISLTTVDNAYSQLLAEGFIYSKPRSGYFVCEIDELIFTKENKRINDIESNIGNNNGKSRIKQENKNSGLKITKDGVESKENILVDFSANQIDTRNFPYNNWKKMMKDSFNEYDENILNITHPQGDEDLRESIKNYVYQARGVNCSRNQIIIGAGTDNIIQILSYILKKEYSIVMENPVYNKARFFFKKTGHNVKEVDIDSLGIPIEVLENKNNIAIYVTPSHQFPLGFSMPINRRIQLLNWANKGMGRFIIEDDYDSEFRYDTRVIPSLKSIDENGKVIYLGTFSKSISPALRISYMILPEELLEIYKKDYIFFSSSVSKLDQLVLNEFIKSGKFESHVNKMRKIYKKKREVLVEELKKFGSDLDILGEKAGHHILVRLNLGLSEAKMCQKALEYGVKVYPISEYFNSKMPCKYENQVMIGYGGLNEEEIIKGVDLLRKAWH